MAGVRMNPVPDTSGPAMKTKPIGGQAMLFTADFTVTVPQHEAGNIRGLAVASTRRSSAAPDLPTVDEVLGPKDSERTAHSASFPPAGIAAVAPG